MLNPGVPPQQPPPAAAGGPHGAAHPPPQILPPQAPLPQPPLAGGILPVLGHLDYLSRYQDASVDPYQMRYDGLMDVFAVPLQGAAIPPAALLTQVGDSTIAGVPSAFLMLVEDATNPLQPGQVMCFHRVAYQVSR
jgi:hypothetical protein